MNKKKYIVPEESEAPAVSDDSALIVPIIVAVNLAKRCRALCGTTVEGCCDTFSFGMVPKVRVIVVKLTLTIIHHLRVFIEKK